MVTPNLADLILVRGTSLIDYAVEDITHSPYSHVAGIVKPNELVEAQGGRSTGYQALDSYEGVADVYTCPSVTDEQRQQIVDFVLKRIGTHYNYELVGWEFVHFMLHFDIAYRERTCYDCSELWSEAYKASGIVLRPDLEHVAPGDLAESPLLCKVGPL